MAKLDEKAMLVTLSISQWKARKLDKDVSRKTRQERGATEDAGNFHKLLIAKDAIDKVSQLVTRIRKYNYSMTVPWNDMGARIIKSDAYFDYTAKMAEFQSEFYDTVNELLNEYPALKRDAEYRRLKGDLFNSDDYPTVDKLRNLFSFALTIDPMPSTDFRVQLTGSEIDRIQKDLEDRYAARMKNAMGDVWARLYEVVSKMAETLGDPDKGFHGTLVTNISDLLDVMPHLNITDDPELDAMSQTVRDKLTKYDASILKEDKDVRKSTAKAASEILDAMAAYMGA
jgi:hypothetical protein